MKPLFNGFLFEFNTQNQTQNIISFIYIIIEEQLKCVEKIMI